MAGEDIRGICHGRGTLPKPEELTRIAADLAEKRKALEGLHKRLTVEEMAILGKELEPFLGTLSELEGAIIDLMGAAERMPEAERRLGELRRAICP